MIDKTKALDNYTRGLSSIGKARNIFIRFITDFLEYADGRTDRETVTRYQEHLRIQHHYSDGTINLIFRAVRTLFNRNGWEWPFRRGEAPTIREDRVQAPALHPTTIKRAIEAVKTRGTPEVRAFEALSTTYGLRRIEMVELRAEDVRLKDRIIHIATAKHGRERTHLIPDQIIPHLAGYDFSQGRSENFIFSLWYQVEYMINLQHIHKVGWHSQRRTLNTILLRRLPEATVMSFMRWKQRTSSHMPYRYSAQRFVGEEEESVEVVGDALDVDSQVFKVHPFIEFWR